jgi:hypothetical protein
MQKQHVGIGVLVLVVIVAGWYFVGSKEPKAAPVVTPAPVTPAATTTDVAISTESYSNGHNETDVTPTEANVVLDEDGRVSFYDDATRLTKDVSFKVPTEWYTIEERTNIEDDNTLVRFYDDEYKEISTERIWQNSYVFTYSKKTWRTSMDTYELFKESDSTMTPTSTYSFYETFDTYMGKRETFTIDNKEGMIYHYEHPQPESIAIGPDNGWYAVFEYDEYDENGVYISKRTVYTLHLQDDYPNAEQTLMDIVESLDWGEVSVQ